MPGHLKNFLQHLSRNDGTTTANNINKKKEKRKKKKKRLRYHAAWNPFPHHIAIFFNKKVRMNVAWFSSMFFLKPNKIKNKK